VNTAEQPIKQRENERFQVQTGVLAEPETCITRVSHVIDISMSGLAFTYVDEKAWSEASDTLNLSFPLKGFFLRHLPFEALYDFLTVNKYSKLPIRRRGGKFGRLTRPQSSLLKYFIDNYTTARADMEPRSNAEGSETFFLVRRPGPNPVSPPSV